MSAEFTSVMIIHARYRFCAINRIQNCAHFLLIGVVLLSPAKYTITNDNDNANNAGVTHRLSPLLQINSKKKNNQDGKIDGKSPDAITKVNYY